MIALPWVRLAARGYGALKVGYRQVGLPQVIDDTFAQEAPDPGFPAEEVGALGFSNLNVSCGGEEDGCASGSAAGGRRR